MKRLIILMGLMILTFTSQADEETTMSNCTNNNVYLQQSCERLQQSANKIQTERKKTYQDELTKNKSAIQKRIAAEKDASNTIETEPSAPTTTTTAADLPSWQKSLSLQTPDTKTANNNVSNNQITNSANLQDSPTTDDTTPTDSITVLPPPGPTQFSSPKPKTLPGGINVVPSAKQNTIDIFNSNNTATVTNTNMNNNAGTTNISYY